MLSCRGVSASDLNSEMNEMNEKKINEKKKKKSNFFKWVFSKWHYWLIVVIFVFFSYDLSTMYIEELIGIVFGSVGIVLLFYLIFWRGAKSKLSKQFN